MDKNPEESDQRRIFGKRLQGFRKAKFSNVEGIAKELGIKPETYAKYEGRSYPPPHLFPMLAKILEVDILELLTGELSGIPLPLSDSAQNIALRWQALPDALKKQSSDYIDSLSILVKTCPSLMDPRTGEMYLRELAFYRKLEAQNNERNGLTKDSNQQ